MWGGQTILTLGLDEQQIEIVKKNTPTKGYQVEDVTDFPTDLVAADATVLIVNGEVIDADTKEMLISCYTELGNSSAQALLWYGGPAPPKHLRKIIKYFSSFDAMAEKLKYHLLMAHSKIKKAEDFSRKLSLSIKILALIRKYPGITSRELSIQTEIPIRTIQRYITALQVAGEWIEYDTKNKGWQLQDGISILYEDHIEGENIWANPERQ